MNQTFATTLPYDDHPGWAEQARLLSPARARQDLDFSRAPARPGLRHLFRVVRALFAGESIALYSGCRWNLDLFALLLARFLFRSRVGIVLFTGDMWEPARGPRLWATRRLISIVDGVVTRWVVHTSADTRCFERVWRIDRAKLAVAPYGYTPDWSEYEPLVRDEPYVFAGGDSHRDFGPVIAAARALPDLPFVVATSRLDDTDLPPNIELISVARPSYQAALTGCAVVVVPLRASLQRSAGQQTYLNAMQSGKITIVPGVAGVDEYITPGVDGIVVDGDAPDFVEAIRWAMSADDETRTRMQGAARRAAAGKSFAVHADRILAILDEAAGRRLAEVQVAMVLQSYLPVVGGAQGQLAQLLPMFAAQATDSVVITRVPDLPAAPVAAPALRAPTADPAEIDGVDIVRIPVSGSGPIRSLRFSLSAVAEIRRRRPDVVHAFDLLSPTTTALAAKVLLRTPVVSKVLRGGSLGDLERLRVKPFGSLRLRWMRRSLDRVIVISDEIEQELLAAGFAPHQLARIHNGVDIDRFMPATDDERGRQRAALGLPQRPVALFTGRLDVEKRVDLLIEQWRQVTDTVGPAGLIIVGDGPERTRLEAMAGPDITFVGPIDDVVPYVRAADVFVLPSSTEGLSNSLLEAMAAGLAVVCTKVGGAGDVIDHESNGLLIALDDGLALCDALVTALGDQELRQRLGRAARVTMVEEFSLVATAGKLGALYRELAFSGPR